MSESNLNFFKTNPYLALKLTLDEKQNEINENHLKALKKKNKKRKKM